jgi:carbamoyltransferase
MKEKTNEYIIGVSAFYHDSSACLFKNGELVFACEEERFTGIKHDSSFPINTINYIFEKYGISRDDVSVVCYYESPKLKYKRVWDTFKKNFFKSPMYCVKSLLNITQLSWKIENELRNVSNNIFYSQHHSSHLYYSGYTSKFKKSFILSIDGVGEFDTITAGYYDEFGVTYSSLGKYPHSLGLFYSAMTSYLGFKPNEGEYKLMGLASYGKENHFIDLVRKLVKWENGEIVCDMDKFCWDRDDKLMFNHKLIQYLGIEPRNNEDITEIHKNLAYATQKVYEEVLFKILNQLHLDTQNLCLGGGSAYNGTANGKIVKNTPFKNIWIPVAPSDAGSSVGACIYYMVHNGIEVRNVNTTPFLGPEYEYDEIIKTLPKNKVRKYTNKKLMEVVAKELHNEKVVGWFYGGIEFGARALGNRSILASPFKVEMKDKINKVIKKREGFRPFAPMVLKEKQHNYFNVYGDVPYMNQVVEVKDEYQSILGGVTHINGTARIQTVYKKSRIYKLLEEFEKISGYPILLNTSFNVKDKTMVLTPENALDTFYDTEMDILVLGNYVIRK